MRERTRLLRVTRHRGDLAEAVTLQMQVHQMTPHPMVLSQSLVSLSHSETQSSHGPSILRGTWPIEVEVLLFLCAMYGAENKVLCPEASARHLLLISELTYLFVSTVQNFLGGSHCEPPVTITSP